MLMSKNKNNSNIISFEQLNERFQNLGFALMLAAATAGIVEMGDHRIGRELLAAQPVFTSEQGQLKDSNNPLRREREEEAGSHYVSYNVAMRTPGRTRYYS